jgi:hypothetical protein
MAKAMRKSKDIADLMTDWQGIEAGTVESIKSELRKTKNPFIKSMLQLIMLEAEKHRLLQQMIVDSVKKEAVNLSPDELGVLSGHINRYLEAEGRELCVAEATTTGSSPFVTRYLFSYLIEDLKVQSCMLKQFDDELKNASIPTSVTAKRFGASKAV